MWRAEAMNLPSRDLLLHSRRNSPPYNKAQLFNQSALDCSAWSGRKHLLSAPFTRYVFYPTAYAVIRCVNPTGWWSYRTGPPGLSRARHKISALVTFWIAVRIFCLIPAASVAPSGRLCTNIHQAYQEERSQCLIS